VVTGGGRAHLTGLIVVIVIDAGALVGRRRAGKAGMSRTLSPALPRSSISRAAVAMR
jgi:hypothetical protein